ncbi:MAG: hypothetical protein ACLFUI_02885, partial [Halanaerobiales bacterium]
MKYIKKTAITALFIILLIGITGVGLTGCSEKPPADSSNQPSSDVSSEADLSEENSEENLQEESDILEDITVNYIDFERVNPAVLNEEIKNIIEANKQEAGYRLID